MSEFVPNHVPNTGDLDQFTRDYLTSAEWLLDEDTADDATGFAPCAIKSAIKTCARFQKNNAEDLAAYEDATGYTGGNDFWLTRNGHGAGFWDRGLGELGERLTAAAQRYSECDTYVGDDGLIYFS